MALHQRGQLAGAQAIYREILEDQPRHFSSLHLLGVADLQLGRPESAVELIAAAIAIDPNVAAAYYNRGIALTHLRRLAEALASYDKAVELQPDYAEAHYNRGNTLKDLKRFDEALASYDRAISLKPDFAEPFNNRGLALQELKRFDEALASYDRAIVFRPDHAVALNNRGNSLQELKRLDEALASYDRAIVLKPDYAEAHYNRGITLQELKRFDEALAGYDRAIVLKPDYAEAHYNRGVALQGLKRFEESLASYDRAISIRSDYAEAHYNRGVVFFKLRRHGDAFAAFDKAMSIKPDLDTVEGNRLHAKTHLCNWDDLDREIGQLTASLRSGRAAGTPFAFLLLTDSPDDHLRAARAWIAAKHPATAQPLFQGRARKHDRIRVGYVSANLHKHAIAYLTAELFELHDRTRFSIGAFSLGPDDNSDIRRRLIGAFDHFVDCRRLSDDQVARAVVDAEIDILVDVTGFTQDARTGIFSCRPAPVQINYLGYPGTMGASYFDYVIGDKTLFTSADAAFYVEKLVQLPGSYQPNDRKRQISANVLTRQDMGLPESGFVFCCFNNHYKILPSVFDSWMRILKSVDGSVLWLLVEGRTAIANLRKEAAARGVDEGRLIFAGRMELADHLARHRLADLFLDTLPYNAHTTTSDALWAGLPVLTQTGRAFAGRVAASLLTATGLPELITRTSEQYETLAIELARNRDRLRQIRNKLEKNRLASPLFDTKSYANHIEAAYQAMNDRFRAGLPPEHIVVPA